jgi:hypothetical protein
MSLRSRYQMATPRHMGFCAHKRSADTPSNKERLNQHAMCAARKYRVRTLGPGCVWPFIRYETVAIANLFNLEKVCATLLSSGFIAIPRKTGAGGGLAGCKAVAR